MLRILLVLALGLTSGSILALGASGWPIRPGLLGLLLAVVAAVAARRRWLGLALAAPGSPERALWIGLGSAALICGHLVASLWQIGPRMVLHDAAGHALGIDSWTLVFGGVLAYAIARDPRPRRDERDLEFAQLGLRCAHTTLMSLLVGLALVLGFGLLPGADDLSMPLVAHVLIAAVLVSLLVDHAVRLARYRDDARLGEGAE